MLYRYLIHYTNADGQLARVGGLDHPGIRANSADEAIEKALASTTPFVRSRWHSVQVRLAFV